MGVEEEVKDILLALEEKVVVQMQVEMVTMEMLTQGEMVVMVERMLNHKVVMEEEEAMLVNQVLVVVLEIQDQLKIIINLVEQEEVDISFIKQIRANL